MNYGDTVILEGFHACKHAVRFGADILELVTADKKLLETMLEEHAPDVSEQILSKVKEIDSHKFDAYSNVKIRTPLAGTAKVPQALIDAENSRPVVLLDNPRDLENIGAVVRLAAGMGCAAVVTTGDVNPWHKNCLRGSQGLHYALPVLHQNDLDINFFDDKTIVAFDERGIDISEVKEMPTKNVVLAFGSERAGMSLELKGRANELVKIPQRDGVASYNLATSVAMGVYHFKYK